MSNDQINSILAPTFQTTVKTVSEREAVISIEPLEQGYGHTLGNALRRVLLTSLTGAAITSVRFTDADHQFTTLPGVTEDMLEISLNLKSVRIKADREGTGVIRLSVKGPKVITAADLEPEAGFSVVNPDQAIATLAKDSKLELELVVQTGRGYVLADEKAESLGSINLDALYSPVIKVSYSIEQTRVGRRTDYDNLIMTITTDGTISPHDAVVQAADLLVKQFSQVVTPVVVESVAPVSTLSPEQAEVMRLTVEELDLPTRIANALRKGGFKTVGDLIGAPKQTIAKVKNLGEKSVDIVDAALQKKGVQLGA
ncbi:DNA-directed RNA polymerase subunit alpha [Candidatus Woesebacteria bacterium]|nr:DNA-directed RNA polymerase subunit alpha [Candidatus Woesebacteria bacterium]